MFSRVGRQTVVEDLTYMDELAGSKNALAGSSRLNDHDLWLQ